jgi:hypothetical protein
MAELLLIIKEHAKKEALTRDRIRRLALQRGIIRGAPTVDLYLTDLLQRGAICAETIGPKQRFTPYRYFQITANGEALVQVWQQKRKEEEKKNGKET